MRPASSSLKGSAVVFAALAVVTAAAFARPNREVVFTPEEEHFARQFPEAFEGVTVSIERLGPAYGVREAPPTPPDAGGDDELVILDRIVNIARKVWDIIKENEPVVNTAKDYANAVPEGIKRWESLVGWKTPVGTVYGFKAVNKFGAQVVYVKYQVLRTHGGGYVGKDGIRRGKYLTGVTVEPLLVDVGWGYKLDLVARAPTVVNAGESEDDPLAGMVVNLEWRIATPLQKTQGVAVYYVRGDGHFAEIGGPFSRDFKSRAPLLLERIPAAAGGLLNIRPAR